MSWQGKKSKFLEKLLNFQNILVQLNLFSKVFLKIIISCDCRVNAHWTTPHLPTPWMLLVKDTRERSMPLLSVVSTIINMLNQLSSAFLIDPKSNYNICFSFVQWVAINPGVLWLCCWLFAVQWMDEGISYCHYLISLLDVMNIRRISQNIGHYWIEYILV